MTRFDSTNVSAGTAMSWRTDELSIVKDPNNFCNDGRERASDDDWVSVRSPLTMLHLEKTMLDSFPKQSVGEAAVDVGVVTEIPPLVAVERNSSD